MTALLAPPDRSLQQRLEALDHANRIRIHRAQVKRDLKAGRRSIADVLINPEDELATAKILELLLATPKIGRVKADKALRRAQISPSKTVAGITRRQRAELLALVVSGTPHAATAAR